MKILVGCMQPEQNVQIWLAFFYYSKVLIKSFTISPIRKAFTIRFLWDSILKILFLKSFEGCEDSDRINREVFNYELIVRKWIEINPSMEFRCFIVNQTIVAISQRDVRTYYEHIAKEQSIIVQDIFEFFNNRIRSKFPMHNCQSYLLNYRGLNSYFFYFSSLSDVIDVFRPDINSIVLIDVNVFGPLTDSLLFDWEELIAISNRNDLDNLSSLPVWFFFLIWNIWNLFKKFAAF